MIAPLRRRHRWLTAALLVAVPVLYVAALAVRPGEPVMAGLPEVLAAGPPAGAEVVEELGEPFTDPPIAVRVRRGAARWWVELEPREPVARPEILVYWTPAGSAAGQLSPDAFLLGALADARARAFALPPAALGRAGRLVLYSLGHQEVVDAAELPAVGPPPAGEASGPEDEPAEAGS